MGFARAPIEAVGGDWSDVEKINHALERLRGRRVFAVKREGIAGRAKVVWKIIGFQQVVLYRIVMLGDGCANAWNNANPLTAILCARALMETCALIYDFKSQLARLCGDGDFSGIDDLVMNRTFATRLKHWTDNGQGLEAVNILTLIKKMDVELKGALRHYEALSELCHPNSLGHNLLFGALDRDNSTLLLSDEDCMDQGHLLHVLGCVGLFGLVESWMRRIDDLLPGVLDLSEANKPKTGA